MAVYFVAQYTVNDPATYAEYQQGAGPSLAKYGGEVVAFDVGARTVEGSPPGPQTVILKFEDQNKFDTWYQSPEYQAVVGKRLGATSGFAVLSEAMNLGG